MANWFAKLQKDFVLNFVDDNRWRYLTSGLANTLKITFFAVLIGIALGVVIAIVRSTWDKNKETMRPGLGKALLGALAQLLLAAELVVAFRRIGIGGGRRGVLFSLLGSLVKAAGQTHVLVVGNIGAAFLAV